MALLAYEIALFQSVARPFDYHGDMASYAAKARLFTWSTLKTAVINTDDETRPALCANRRAMRR